MTEPESRAWWAPAGIAAAGVALVAVVDIAAGKLAFNDDWMYAWDVRHLVQAHGLRLFPDQQPTALVQVVWAALATAGHPDLPWLRLSLIPFVALLVMLTWKLSTSLGASRFWAATAAAIVVASPFLVYLDASFHSDVVYAALLLASAYFGLRWESGRRGGILGCVVCAVLATLQRQWGVGIPVAVAAALLLRPGGMTRRDAGGLLLLAAGCVAAAALTTALLVTPTLREGLSLATLSGPTSALAAGLRFPSVLAMTAIPFLVALVARPVSRLRGAAIPVLVLGILGLANAAMILLGWSQLLGIDLGNARGIGPITSPGLKPFLFGGFLYLVFSVVVVAGIAVMLVLRSDLWASPWRRPASGATLMVALAATQLLFMAARGFIDRYSVVIAIPLLPVLAAAASRAARPRAARAWAITSLLTLLAASALGEQDLVAWQGARDRLSQRLYASVPADQVDAGYEANAVYYEVPYMDRTGRAPAKYTDPLSPWALHGPEHPAYVLCFAGPADRGASEGYSSLAPGRLYISRRPQDPPCQGQR